MISVEGFVRPFKISIAMNGDIACLTKSPTIKLYVFLKNGEYYCKNIFDIGISDCTNLTFNNKNEIALIDNKNCRLCLYSMELNQISNFDLPGSKYGTLHYDKNNEYFYLSVLDLSIILKISSNCSASSIFFDYSKIKDCKNVNGLAVKNNSLILLDTSQSALFEIILGKSKNNFRRYLEYGRSGIGKVRQPSDVIIFNNQIVIIDKHNYLIQFFDLKLKFTEQIGEKGPGINQFDLPVSACEYEEELYICDQNNDRIVCLDNNKIFNLAITNKFKEGVLRRPSGIAVGQDGKIFVTDRSNNVLQIFDKNLKFVELLGSKYLKLNRPSSISIFNKEKDKIVIAVLERKLGNDSSLNFYKSNNELASFKHYKKFDDSVLNDPQDMDISISGVIHVADTLSRRIIQIDLNGKIVNQVDMKKTSNNERILVKTIHVRDDGHVFTADFDECIVYEFNSKLEIIRELDFSVYKEKIHVIRAVFALGENLILCTRGIDQVLVVDYGGNIIRGINCKDETGYDWNHPVKICGNRRGGIFIIDKENDRVISLAKDLSIKSCFGFGI